MDAHTTQLIAGVIGAALTSPVLVEVAKRSWAGFKGRERDKRAEIDRAHERTEQERRRHDRTREKLYDTQGALAKARKVMLAADCIDPSQIPDFPEYDKE